MILSAKIRTKFDFSKYLAVISVSLRTLPLPSGFCLYSAGGGRPPSECSRRIVSQCRAQSVGTDCESEQDGLKVRSSRTTDEP